MKDTKQPQAQTCRECGWMIHGAVYQCEYWKRLLTESEVTLSNWCKAFWDINNTRKDEEKDED